MRKSQTWAARFRRERNKLTGLKVAGPIKSVVMTNVPGLERGPIAILESRLPPPTHCRICGCSDENCIGCIEITGAPCSWANEKQDVCTACEMG